MRMKRTLLTLLVVLGCLVAKAQSQSLFVTLNDGQKLEFALSTTPEVSVADDMLTITTSETTASYELWTVSTFTYGATTGINATQADAQSFSLQGDRLIVDGTDARVRVFSIDGKAVSLPATNVGSQTVLSIGSLPKGIYVVNINGKSLKITRR